jgi:hypothetical protein
MPLLFREEKKAAFSLSLGERVARDPDSLHRDAGRVRGYSRCPAKSSHR